MHSFMIQKEIKRLEFLINTIPNLLKKIDDAKLSYKSTPEKWSKLETLGHLIDSAANNHQRFIRGQYEDCPKIYYDQNQWVVLNGYQTMNKLQLIDFWTLYNQQIIEILKRMSAESLERKCQNKEGSVFTIHYLITDYIKHLEHHLHQIVEY